MKDEYTESWLSAYFNVLPRSLPNERGHWARAQWLDRHFGGVDIIQSGTKKIAALPSAYFMDVQNDPLELMAGMRERIIPRRFEFTSDSMIESMGRLHAAIVEIAMIGGAVHLYKSKAGQNEKVLKPGKLYSAVYHDDAAHDHNSRHLIDFHAVGMSPRMQRVFKGPYDTYHSHLIEPKLIKN